MKKFMAFLLVGLMLLSMLSGCAGGSSSDASSSQKQAETSAEKSEATQSQAQEESKQESAQEEISAEESEEVSEPEPEDLGDYELRFFSSYNQDTSFGNELRAYCDSVETATDGHVKFTYEYLPDYSMADNLIGFGDGVGLKSSFNAVSRYSYYHLASEEEYKKIIDAKNYESLILPEVVTLPLQGFEDGVAMTNVLWDLYEEDSEYAALLDQYYKVLVLYVSSPLYYADERLTPDVDVFKIDRDVRGYANIYMICCTLDLWNRLPVSYQEKIEAVSGREISLSFAQIFKESRDQNAETWAVSMPEYMNGQYVLLNPESDNYADYQTVFDTFTADWIEDATLVTEVDAEAFLAKVKEMYTAEVSK